MPVTFNEKYTAGEEIEKVNTGQGNAIDYNRRMSRKGSVVVSNAPVPPAGVLVNSDRAYSVIAENLPEFTDLYDEAREHAEREKSIGFLQGIKTYPNAAARRSFSPVPSLAGIIFCIPGLCEEKRQAAP